MINIHSKDAEIDLHTVNANTVEYKIELLGGWSVDLGQFSISFKHKQSGTIVMCKDALWPVQSYAFHKRAKRILIVEIKEAGKYEVTFNSPEAVTVKPSGLAIISFFQSEVPNKELAIYIHT